MKLTKHVGVDVTKNVRISLILTVLPGTEDCLIVYTDRLPENLKENFTHLLGSTEGQAATNLADVLSRRLYSDTGTDLLNTLHANGYIKKVSIDDIEMTPGPAFKIPLRTVLVESGLIPRPIAPTATKFNPHHHNAQAANIGEAQGTARNLLIEADLLEQAARDKREQAYRVAPSMRPGEEPTAAPDLTPSITVPPLDLSAAFGVEAKGTSETGE